MNLLIICKCFSETGLRNLNVVRQSNVIAKVNFHNFRRTSVLLKTSSKPFLAPRRSFFRIFKTPTIEELKIKDNIPDEYKLIYRNTMQRYISITQVVTFVTSFLVVLLTVAKQDFQDDRLDFSKWNMQPRTTDNEVYLYLTAFMLVVVVLHVTISRLPVRIYKLARQKRYVFVTYGGVPFSMKRLVCQVGDVVALPESKSGIIPWGQGRFRVKDQNVILFDQYFHRPADLHIMLGIQRDPDVDD